MTLFLVDILNTYKYYYYYYYYYYYCYCYIKILIYKLTPLSTF